LGFGELLIPALLVIAALCLFSTAGPPPERGPAVTIVAVGDVQLGRGVGRAIARHGPDYPFEYVRSMIQEADLAVFNLECALSAEGIPIPKRYSFKADPATADGLARAGFDVAILANNHSVDCGRWRLPETMDVLRARGIVPVGGGMSVAEAAAPVMVERSGLRIAILARTFILPDGVIYREDVPTIAVYDPDRIEEEVRAAARRADVVIVSLHWGIEYARQPQESQRRIARRLIDAGADLIIGHHTHTPQPVERCGDGLIAYSLGNFVFDSRGEGGRYGTLLRCTLTADGVKNYGALPIRIEQAQPLPDF
jgi:poly-gamma-glutamate capsule biosynthesis protein CapA/YwtB (metallophosphatase superfamily)